MDSRRLSTRRLQLTYTIKYLVVPYPTKLSYFYVERILSSAFQATIIDEADLKS